MVARKKKVMQGNQSVDNIGNRQNKICFFFTHVTYQDKLSMQIESVLPMTYLVSIALEIMHSPLLDFYYYVSLDTLVLPVVRRYYPHCQTWVLSLYSLLKDSSIVFLEEEWWWCSL